ncbi:protein kinase [Corallococcus sp. BB11-1]|uniref:serine/threonine-protein kinase n=1 Tax=Corallococcus sp. BB11-1 TaxID=2996783 RepID=UPI0022700DDE|nr:serine/threonine protein kinase [Corallococcus sp. BB11-1]MCY1030895.1 protein kinase [Corallococcus sp. BB11-1]
MDPLLSSQVGEFIINERIGAGGMGVVYRATHSLIGKQAAIKVLRADLVSPRVHERLLVEARAVNAIQHPGIIDIFGFGSLPDGRPYIVMELLKGRSLAEFAPTPQPLDVATTVWVLDQILAALGAAHEAGVVHRDLKPANVFVVEGPNSAPTIKLVDFGIAKLLESRDSPTTLDGTILGTPEFMAPEQIRGGEVGPATDLYAVGIMAFQMLTGTRPFHGDPLQVMFAQVDRIPPMPSSLAKGIPPEFDTLVRHLLAKDPAMRPALAETVRLQLQRIPVGTRPAVPKMVARSASRAPAPVVTTSGPISRQDTMPFATPRLGKGHRWKWGGALLLAGLGGAIWFSLPASSQVSASSRPVPTPGVPAIADGTPVPSDVPGPPKDPPPPPATDVKTDGESPVPAQPSPTPQSARTNPAETPVTQARGVRQETSPEKKLNKDKTDSRTGKDPRPPLPESPTIVSPPGDSPIKIARVPDNPSTPPVQSVTPPATVQRVVIKPAPIEPAPIVTRPARPTLPQDNRDEQGLANRLDRLFEQLYARSPGGKPPQRLLEELLTQYRNAAADDLSGGERARIKDALDEWEKQFSQALPPSARASAPVARTSSPVAPSPVVAPKPSPAHIEKATPPLPSNPPEPRRSTLAERLLAVRLDRFTAEFRRRTGGNDLTTELGSQLRGFYVFAAGEQTGTERTKIQGEMDEWEKKLKAIPLQ